MIGLVPEWAPRAPCALLSTPVPASGPRSGEYDGSGDDDRHSRGGALPCLQKGSVITITASDSGPAPASDVESVPANLDRGDAPRPTLTRRDVAPLSAAVQGPVLLPADPGFAAECATYNLLNPLRPALVVGASCVADVQAAVRFAGSRGMPVAVSATGHQVRQPANGSVLITLRRMVGTTVDVARRCVRIAGGTNWQEVVDAAAAHGLAPVNGSSMSVGAVGYLLGVA